METIAINGKLYKMPDFTFGDIKFLERSGINMTKLQNLQDHFFEALSAFVQITVKCDEETADDLIEKHAENGGDIIDLLKAYTDALQNSSFFQKTLERQQESKAKRSQKKSE